MEFVDTRFKLLGDEFTLKPQISLCIKLKDS